MSDAALTAGRAKGRSLADLLIEAGLTREKIEDCRRVSAATGDSMDKVLLAKGLLDEPAVLRVYAKHLGYEFRASLDGIAVPQSFVAKVPVQFARNYNLVAVAETDGVVQVATCAPLEAHPMDDLAAMMGCEVDPVLAPRLEITTLLGRRRG